MTGAADTFLQELRTVDPERYLAVLYAPQQTRAALTALYRFDAEIAAIRGRVSEPMPGEIRIQWWRDTITAAGADAVAAGNPLAEALMAAIGTYRLPQAAFEHYLDGRIFDLYDDAMPDRAALEAYAGQTASLIFQLASQILNAGEDPHCADAAGHAGVAFTICRLLCAAPHWLARGQAYVPDDILAAAGADRESLRDGGTGSAATVAAMVALARDHLRQAEVHVAALAPGLQPVFLPLATVGALLSRLEKAGASALTRPVRLSPLRRHWLMLRRAAAIG